MAQKKTHKHGNSTGSSLFSKNKETRLKCNKSSCCLKMDSHSVFHTRYTHFIEANYNKIIKFSKILYICWLYYFVFLTVHVTQVSSKLYHRHMPKSDCLTQNLITSDFLVSPFIIVIDKYIIKVTNSLSILSSGKFMFTGRQ